MSPNKILTTWITDGQFRPPAAYHGHLMGLGGFRALVHCPSRFQLGLSLRQLTRIAIPTVHASASSTGDAPVVNSPNAPVDYLAEIRPKIVITESDILAVLEKETGADRLRAMFHKE